MRLLPFLFCVFILNSFVTKNDDGKTYKTAIRINCASKEHVVLKKIGFKPKIHSSQIYNNKEYDVFMNDKNELMIFEIINNKKPHSNDTIKYQQHEIFS